MVSDPMLNTNRLVIMFLHPPDMSSVSSPGKVAKEKHLKRKTGSTSRRNVTTEELDPARDISRYARPDTAYDEK